MSDLCYYLHFSNVGDFDGSFQNLLMTQCFVVQEKMYRAMGVCLGWIALSAGCKHFRSRSVIFLSFSFFPLFR